MKIISAVLSQKNDPTSPTFAFPGEPPPKFPQTAALGDHFSLVRAKGQSQLEGSVFLVNKEFLNLSGIYGVSMNRMFNYTSMTDSRQL
jgi:hypothetical protein